MLKIRKKDIVTDYIKKKISTGEWGVGTALPSEPILAKEIGVSRMSVREGIEQLSILKVLEKKRGSGTYVREVTPTISFNNLYPDIEICTEGYREILEVRIVLENLALEKSIKNNKEELENSLEKILEKMKNIEKDKNFIDYDMAFHVEISKYSDNKLLLGLLQLTFTALKVHKKNYEYNYVDNRLRIKEHEKIYLAIKEGNIKKAQKYLTIHLEKAIKKIIE